MAVTAAMLARAKLRARRRLMTWRNLSEAKGYTWQDRERPALLFREANTLLNRLADMYAARDRAVYCGPIDTLAPGCTCAPECIDPECPAHGERLAVR